MACYPWKIWVLVTLRHRKVFLKLCCLNVGSARDYCNLFALAFELALFRFVTSPMSPKKDETAVPALSVLFLLVSCKVNFTCSISLVVMSLQY